MSECCPSFSRSQLLHRAAAGAGRGLPAIEPGMPLPAGTGLSRRAFLLRSSGLALAVYGATALGPRLLEDGVAHAAEGPAAPILVSVFLPGGLDGLSVLAPLGDAAYARLRPTLAVPEAGTTPLPEDDRLHWHPAAAPLAALHAEGKVAVMPAVGYERADHSHFTSRHFWEVGGLDPHQRLGWMGRYLDLVGSADNPLQGLAMQGSLSPALASARVPVAALSDPAGYNFGSPQVTGAVADRMVATMADLGRLPTSDPVLGTVRETALHADALRRTLAPAASRLSPNAAGYPSGPLGQRLGSVAAMLAAGLPLRCVTLSATADFDTHANQAASFEGGLREVCDSVHAFQRDLESRGLADRVLTHVWSEFGRRPRENGSGTDHGAAGAGFLVGTRVRGGLVGEFGGLSDLDPSGNLRSTVDYRAVYSSLLEQWLGVDAGQVIPEAARLGRPLLVT